MTLDSVEISAGKLFFRHRNWLFPVITVILFMTAAPPTTLLGSEFLEHSKDVLAVIVCFGGLAIRGLVIGFAYIKRGGVNKQVFAERLQTAGMFQLCRNPIYCGNMLIWPSIFLMHGNVWVVLIGTASFYEIYRCIIRNEEDYLLTKFGAEYERYCQDTPRWIPVLSRLQEAVKDMHFDWGKVILNDYGTIATAIIGLALVEYYEYWSLPGATDAYFATLRTIIFCTLAGVVIIKLIKRRRAFLATVNPLPPDQSV